MAVPKNQGELIFEIKNNYSKLEKDLDDITMELTKRKEFEGHAKGTKMSVSDLVAYLIS